MSIAKRLKLKLARLITTPSAAKIRADIRRHNKQGLMTIRFYQGEVGHE